MVHESLVNQFTNHLSDQVFNTLVLKNPMDDSSNYGCITSINELERLDGIVQDAQKQGGIVTVGGFKNTDD